MAVLPLAVAIVEACPGGDAAVAPDRNPSWDSDGDTISTAVELESHNHNLYNYDTLLFDQNRSIASGTRGSGLLDWGLNLPDTGFGYIHFPNETKDTDDWGTLSLINVLEFAARRFRRDPPCLSQPYANPSALPRMQTGDMSRWGGGVFYFPFPDTGHHSEHQNGLDVDVRYIRYTGEQPLDLALPGDLPAYDVVSTAELLQCFLSDSRRT